MYFALEMSDHCGNRELILFLKSLNKIVYFADDTSVLFEVINLISLKIIANEVIIKRHN